MQYLITFLEGMITFISPCVLPMLPVYALYFTAGEQEGRAGRALTRALGFVLGFTLLFVALGVFAASLGALLAVHQRAVNLVTGAVVVLFGLHYMGALRIGLLQRTVRPDVQVKAQGFFSCALLIDRLKGALAAVKRHYAVVNRVCGAFLVLVGVLMMTGLFARLSALLA